MSPEEEARRRRCGEQLIEDPIEPVYRTDPVLVGAFTDWVPRKMMTVFDLIQDKEPDDRKLDYRSYFNYLKKNHDSEYSDVDKFEELTINHMRKFTEGKKAREKEVFATSWKSMFDKVMSYKKPFFVNSESV